MDHGHPPSRHPTLRCLRSRHRRAGDVRDRRLLPFACEMPNLGVDNRSVEILDCGAGGLDASAIELPLVAARERFTTVFRGEGVPDLTSIALPADVDPPRPGLTRLPPIGGL